MELEDLIDGTLFSCGREVIGLMNSGDHAARVAGREYVARRIWEVLHHNKAVLRRVERQPSSSRTTGIATRFSFTTGPQPVEIIRADFGCVYRLSH